jgi:hypothetical protein
MPGPTATAGVVGVPCSSATDRTTTSVARSAGGWFVPAFKTPLKSPLVQGGTLFLIERGAATRHETPLRNLIGGFEKL